MKRWVLLLLPLLFLAQLNGQRIEENVDSYVEQYAHVAVSEMEKYGIPASITLAQGILESACGQSDLAKRSNNHFGIKCKSHWKGKTVRHTDDAPNECFRAYDSVWESYRDHSDFLKNHRLHFYDHLFELDPHDYVGWAYGLKQAGYATAANYPQKLVALIEQYELFKYDDATFDYESVIVRTEDLAEPVQALEKARENGQRNYQFGYEFSDLIPHLRKKSAVIVQQHGGKLHLVTNEDSMETIAERHNVSVDLLYERNKLIFGAQPAVGEWVYVHSYADKAPRLRKISY